MRRSLLLRIGVLISFVLVCVLNCNSAFAVYDSDCTSLRNLSYSSAAERSRALAFAGCEDSTIDTVASPANKVINTLLYIVGILAVLMIVYGGVQYATSAGDAGKVQKAKNIILYAVVGLLIAILAYAIVNFVVTGLLK